MKDQSLGIQMPAVSMAYTGQAPKFQRLRATARFGSERRSGC